MHEVGLLEGMIDQLASQLTSDQLAELSSVHLTVGCRSGVDLEAMRFAFEATRGHHPNLAAQAELVLKVNQAELTCTSCQHSWQDSQRLPTCPLCGSVHCTAEGGNELMITHVEIG